MTIDYLLNIVKNKFFFTCVIQHQLKPVNCIFYDSGDRALPIRWSAPETIECTDTTIETREITSRANLWSYAVLLWEIATWGKRPYENLGDEKVIEMLLSPKSGMKSVGPQLLLQNSENCASNLTKAIRTCLVLEPDKRFSLEQVNKFQYLI